MYCSYSEGFQGLPRGLVSQIEAPMRHLTAPPAALGSLLHLARFLSTPRFSHSVSTSTYTSPVDSDPRVVFQRHFARLCVLIAATEELCRWVKEPHSPTRLMGGQCKNGETRVRLPWNKVARPYLVEAHETSLRTEEMSRTKLYIRLSTEMFILTS